MSVSRMNLLCTTSVEGLIRRCKEIPQGKTNDGLKVFIRGIVETRKSDFETVPLFFRLTTVEESGHSILVRWVEDGTPSETKYYNETFDWVNGNLEEGCTVDVRGFLRHTKNGKPMLDAVSVTLISHPQDSENVEDESDTVSEEESEENDDDADADYVPEQDSEEENDDEDFRKYVEDVSESEEEKEEILPHSFKVNRDITLTTKSLFFHGKEFDIIAFRTKPGRVTLKSALGNFHFDRMDEKYISVLVPANKFEPSFQHGYTTLIKGDFRKILEILI